METSYTDLHENKLTLFLTFLKIGAFTFGGGYAMLALLDREFVDRKHGSLTVPPEKNNFINTLKAA